MIKGKSAFWIIVFLSFLSAGCASKNTLEYYVRPQLNLASVQSVAVLPFEDPAGNPAMAVQCRQITINQILASGLFDVVEKMEVDRMLQREAVAPSQPIDATELRRLGQLLGVQAFLVGSLNESGMQQKGAAVYPEITLTMRLIDSATGIVLWHATGRESGYSIWGRLFGLEFEDPYQASTNLIRKLLRSIGERPGPKG